MGCLQSKIEREETVSRCNARKRYMKHFLQARQAFSTSHASYVHSLRSTASALLHFANTEQNHHHPPPPQPQPPMLPLPPMLTSLTASAAPPSPPPPPTSSAWEFWDPFDVSPPSTVEEWDAAVSKEELAMVVSRNNNEDLVQVVKEVHDYFLQAADAAAHVSLLLEVSTTAFPTHPKASKVQGHRWSLSPSLWSCGSSPKLCEKNIVSGGGVSGSHCSTVERLYTWEKKLCQEVKNVESIKMEHEKKVARLRKLGMKKADNMKTEKINKEVEKLESQMLVGSHAIDTTNAEIIKLRETQLYPQLNELVKGLMCMWRCMYEYHQVQKHIVQRLEYLNTIPSTIPTSEIQRQSTLQLELEIQQWHYSFCSLFKTHRDYIQSLTGWLRLSLFQFRGNSLNETTEESKKIYTLCEEWNLAVDRIPDKVESKGINNLLTAIHAIVVQQTEEHKQKKKLDAALKELEKKVVELQSVECKYGPNSKLESLNTMKTKGLVTKKHAQVEHLRVKVEEERIKHERSIGITRAMTLNNLQMGFPQAFQGIEGFSRVCMEVFESVYNKAKIAAVQHDVKRILPLENGHGCV